MIHIRGELIIQMMPFGMLDNEIIIILVRNLRIAVLNTPIPKRLWVVYGSGLLISVLSQVWPETEFLLVRVGKQVTPEILEFLNSSKINYRIFPPNDQELPQWFENSATILPPYPSVKTYDAKIWQYVLTHGETNDYIWNVASD